MHYICGVETNKSDAMKQEFNTLINGLKDAEKQLSNNDFAMFDIEDLKSRISNLRQLVERPLNIGVFGGDNIQKSSLINALLSLSEYAKFPEYVFFENVTSIRGTFDKNQGGMQVKIIDDQGDIKSVNSDLIYTPKNTIFENIQSLELQICAENELTSIFADKNIIVTNYLQDGYFNEIKKSDLAIVVINIEEYEGNSKLLNYIVEKESITIPIIIVFVGATKFDNGNRLYEKFNDVVYLCDSNKSLNNIREILLRYVSSTNTPFGKSPAKIFDNRIKLVQNQIANLKTTIRNLETSISESYYQNGCFDIDSLIDSSEVREYKKVLISAIESEYKSYIIEVQNLIAELTNAENFDEIERIITEISKKDNFVHHSENVEIYYSKYIEKVEKQILDKVESSVSDAERKIMIKNDIKGVFSNIETNDFGEIFAIKKPSIVKKVAKKIEYRISLETKNFVAIVTNPSLLMVISIGIGLSLLVTWVTSKINGWLMNKIISALGVDIEKFYFVCLVILITLLTFVYVAIWFATRKNRQIEFNKYKTDIINYLRTLEKTFPRQNVKEIIDNADAQIADVIRNLSKNLGCECRNTEKQKERLTDITYGLLNCL